LTRFVVAGLGLVALMGCSHEETVAPNDSIAGQLKAAPPGTAEAGGRKNSMLKVDKEKKPAAKN
jgi:hypothetical protein